MVKSKTIPFEAPNTHKHNTTPFLYHRKCWLTSEPLITDKGQPFTKNLSYTHKSPLRNTSCHQQEDKSFQTLSPCFLCAQWYWICGFEPFSLQKTQHRYRPDLPESPFITVTRVCARACHCWHRQKESLQNKPKKGIAYSYRGFASWVSASHISFLSLAEVHSGRRL